MKKFISQIIFVLTLSSIIFAQSDMRKFELLDEFRNIGMDEYLMRLDVLAMKTQERNDESIILMRITGGSKIHNNYSAPFVKGGIYQSYWASRGYPKKTEIQHCDLVKEDILTQFFIIPPDSPIPECNEKIVIPNETTLFNTKFYENPYVEYENYLDFEGLDQGIAKVEKEILNELLKKSPESKIYLIGYLGSNRIYGSNLNDKGEYEEVRRPDKPKILQKILKENRNMLIKNGVHSSRISIINGGYKDSVRQVEIWFIPKGGEIPKEKPDYFPKKKL